MVESGNAGGKVRDNPGNYIWRGLGIVLGLVFIGASLYKIKSPPAFAHEIFNYRILPSWAINPAAIVIPWVQLFSGLALVSNRFKKGAAVLLVSMMVVFQIAVASALIRGLNISCGCFKSGGDPATWLTFFRDFLILAGTALVSWRAFHPSSQEKPTSLFNS